MHTGLSKRELWVRAVEERLGTRRLVWMGPRGDDVRPLEDVLQLCGTISLIAPWRDRSTSVSLEDLTGHRVDLERFDLDAYVGPPAKAFWAAAMGALRAPSVLLPYRALQLVKGLGLTRRSEVHVLAMNASFQASFEDKAWIGEALGPVVSTLPWRYVERADTAGIDEELDSGPVVFRADRTSGGEGLFLAHTLDEVYANWSEDGPRYLGMTALLEGATSLNVGGVVWKDGVSVHPASVQLVGLPGLTTRRFGYCGNDFAATRHLDPNILDELEHLASTVGRFLLRHQYRGAFGVDALWHEGNLLFTELNPRFQGSSRASSMISTGLDEPCIFVDHIAACLDMGIRTKRRSLLALALDAPPLSSFVVHNLGAGDLHADHTLVERLTNNRSCREVDLVPGRRVTIEPGGVMARVFVDGSVLATGGALEARWQQCVNGADDRRQLGAA